MAYGLGRREDSETVLVLDLGGGTYDVSLLEGFDGIFEVGLLRQLRLTTVTRNAPEAAPAETLTRALDHARPPELCR